MQVISDLHILQDKRGEPAELKGISTAHIVGYNFANRPSCGRFLVMHILLVQSKVSNRYNQVTQRLGKVVKVFSTAHIAGS